MATRPSKAGALLAEYTAATEDRYNERLTAPRSLLRRAELYERAGDAARAAEHYARFLALWQDAEPELRPVVDDVRRRLAARAPDRKER